MNKLERAKLYKLANELLDLVDDPLAGQLGLHQSHCHAVKVAGAECDCEGYGEYVAAGVSL